MTLNRKMKLADLRVQSFVTAKSAQIRGGTNQSVDFECQSVDFECPSVHFKCQSVDFECASIHFDC